MSKLDDDPRIDPRIKALLGGLPVDRQADVADRDALLAEAHSPAGIAQRQLADAMMDGVDSEEIAPSAGLDIGTIEFMSQPDGNTVKIQLIRPKGDDVLPCVYYIHGGGMQTMSCFNGMYRTWGRLLAHQGVARHRDLRRRLPRHQPRVRGGHR